MDLAEKAVASSSDITVAGAHRAGRTSMGKGVDASIPYSILLVAINAFTSVLRDGMGPLASTYLLVQGWKERDIGSVMFFNLIATVCFQTAAGDLIDRTTRKVHWTSTACLLVGVCTVSMVWYESYTEVLLTRILQGIGSAIVPPAMGGITLGLVGLRHFDAQVPLNEVGNRGGYASIAVLSAVAAQLGKDEAWTYLVFGCGVLAVLCVNMIPSDAINHARARGDSSTYESDDHASTYAQSTHSTAVLPEEKDPDQDWSTYTQKTKAVGYMELLSNHRILLFCMCVFTFHTANAAMLPLLGQMMSVDNKDTAIQMACLTIIIGRGTMAVVASVLSRNVDKYGRKPLLMVGFCAVPLRAVIIVMAKGNPVLLLATQILDGLGDGTYGVMHQVICNDMTQGTGRFNIILGLITTCHMLGGATSNLIGEILADHLGYDAAFLILGAMALIPVLLYGLMFPETKPGMRISQVRSVHERTSIYPSNSDSNSPGDSMNSHVPISHFPNSHLPFPNSISQGIS